jgi:hypothetical protein
LNDFIELEKGIKNSTDLNLRKAKRMKMPEIPKLDDEFFCDPENLINLQHQLEVWLDNMIRSVNLDKCACPVLNRFITPNESDIAHMERELENDGGLEGTWFEHMEVLKMAD